MTELEVLASRGGDLLMLQSLAHEDGASALSLKARLERLGYSTLGSRLRVIDSLVTTPTESLPMGKIDWSKSDFYMDAEMLSNLAPGSFRPQQEKPKSAVQYFIVSVERVAVRNTPRRSGKALDVLRRGAAVRVTNIESHTNDGVHEEWARLHADEGAFMVSKPEKDGYAWMLMSDAKLGELLTLVPSQALHTPDGAPVFNDQLSPTDRTIAAVTPLREALNSQKASSPPDADTPLAVATRKPDAQIIAEAKDILQRLEADGGRPPTADETLVLQEADERLAGDPGDLVDIDHPSTAIAMSTGGVPDAMQCPYGAAVSTYQHAAGPAPPTSGIGIDGSTQTCAV